MHAYQEKLDAPWYYCHDCAEWHQAELRYWTHIKVTYEGPEEDFDLGDAIYESQDRVAGDECGCTDEDPDDHCFSTFSEGELIWVCGDCEYKHVSEEDAVACCQ